MARILPALLFLLLALPALASWHYSLARDPLWLLQALAGLALILAVVRLAGGLLPRLARRLWLTAAVELIAVFQFSRLVSFYFQGESFNQRFFFHLDFGNVVDAGPAYLPLVLAGALYLLAAGLLALLWNGRQGTLSGRARTLLAGVALLGAVVVDPDAGRLAAGQIEAAFSRPAELSADSIDWAGLGLDPAALEQEAVSAAPGRNLVLVYLESLERIYTDDSLFPGLTPNLDRLMDGALVFDNLHQTEGTSWTVGGLVASQCGTPLLYESGPGGNDVLQSGFLNRAVCLGDVLARAGYRQHYLGGAALGFAGKGNFLADHGYDEVKGRAALAPLLEDAGYLSGWGLYDDSLFALAAEEYRSLAGAGAPFNLTLLTLDTHHPEGDASRSCPRYGAIDNSILHAVHCSDFLLGRFVETLRANPAWEDTVLVLLSDHLAMRNVAQQYYPRDYQRKLLFAVLNAGREGRIDTAGSHMDIAPTLLDLLGVAHDVRFLAGASLLDSAAAPPAPARLASLERLQAIRHVNSRLLTARGGGLCDAPSPLSAAAGRLRIGGREVLPSVAGEPLPLNAIGTSHALLALLDAEGAIRSVTTFPQENLPHVLYQAGGRLFLLAAGRDALRGIAGEDQLRGDVNVMLGRGGGSLTRLGGADSADALALPAAGCAQALAAASAAPVQPAPALGAICESPEASVAYLEENAGAPGERLRLPQVAFENGWYEAVLEGSVRDGYAVRERIYLGTERPAPAGGRCHAWFGNDELVIPALRRGGGFAAMALRLIPGRDWEFEVTETHIWR